jgi:general secretion pathway protein I
MRPRGFTLLEVLIALAIVALAVGALLGTITSSGSNVSYLKDKTLAEWVALNRLTEIRTAKLMPDPGKRTGSAEMGGMRWQWEEEVGELPIKGMFRIDVRARPTGETVDDSRELDKPTSQQVAKTESSTSATDKLNWTTTVTGVMSGSRSQLQDAIAWPMRGQTTGSAQGSPNNPTPGSPNTPGAPGVPSNPGTNPSPKPVPGPAPGPAPSER